MIAYIKGEVFEVESDAVIVDKSGIGYRIFVPLSFLGSIRSKDQVVLYTYFNVREDAMQLFGFPTQEELRIFKLLIGISGVGPKAAMSVLSSCSAADLQFAILSGDAAYVAKAQGIGKKTAQKIILELKDKLSLEDAFLQKLDQAKDNDADVSSASEKQDAVEALVALGYGHANALQAVSRAASEGAALAGDLIKAALRYL